MYDVGMLGALEDKAMRQSTQVDKEMNVMVMELRTENNQVQAMAVLDQSKVFIM